MAHKTKFNDGHISLNNAQLGFFKDAMVFFKTIHMNIFSNVVFVSSQKRETLARERFQARYSTSLEQLEQGEDGKKARDAALHSYLTDVGTVQSLKRNKEKLKAELEHVKQVLRHKHICISAGAKMDTLHPALIQTTTMEMS